MKKKRIHRILFLSTSVIVSVGFNNLSVSAEQQVTIDSAETTNSLESSSIEKTESTDKKRKQQAIINNTETTSSIESSSIEKKDTTDVVENEVQQAKTFQVKEALAATPSTPQVNAATENVAQVSTWTEFVKAYTDNSVTKIEFKDDILFGTNGEDEIKEKARTNSIEIDGKGFKLDVNKYRLYLDREAAGSPVITVQNLSDVRVGGTKPASYLSKGFVHANLPYANSMNQRHSSWTINFSNIRNQPGQVFRIANNSGGQVNFLGDVTWYTNTNELLTATGVMIDDNVTVSSYKDTGDQSFFWFDLPPSKKTASDVGTGDMIVGENATLNCRMGENGGTAYPVVFCFYKNFILEEGATFNGTMPGNAYRADYEASSFIAKGNNKINLTSLKTGFSTVDFTENTTRNATKDRATIRKFYIGSGSEFYVESNTNKDLFTTSTIGSLVDIQIDSPKRLDLYNRSSGNYSILSNSSEVKNFTILNSDLNLWTIKESTTKDSLHQFSVVENLSQTGKGNSASSNSGVADLLPLSNIKRINALNNNPTINFIDVTNAHKSITYETILGEFPDENGMDENGHINYIKIYPDEGAASADITDSYGEVYKEVFSGKNGITTITTDKFNQAGKYTVGKAYFGKRTQDGETSYEVWDVVPPDPAVVTSKDIAEGVSSLSGTGEAGASVYLKIDGKAIDAVTTVVDSSGNWTLNFDSSLSKTGSVAQIFLEDHAGKADITNPPETNNEIGNINPETDYPYGDTTFKAATKVTFTKSNFEITASDMTIKAKEYPKTEEDLKALILKDSQATLTNQETNDELESNLINVDISQLPIPSSEKLTTKTCKVTLSYTRGASTFKKEINVKILASSKMEIRQIYKGTTDQPIYSDLKSKIPVESQTVTVENGATIIDIIEQLISEKKITWSYDGYQSPSDKSNYKVYQNGEEISTKPTTVLDDDFSLVYEYEGQLKFGETASNINFGKITLSNDTSTTALDDSSDKNIEIINTVPNGDWTLKASTPEGIKQVDGQKLPYLGSLVYKNKTGEDLSINTSATKIESKKDDDNNLYRAINLKNDDKSGLYLEQTAGNLKGKYEGKIIWTLEDSPNE